MARLILLNGPPGVGKSTLARHFIEDHPLALVLELDALRVSIGRWEEREESNSLAKALALAMARTHLTAGHDVVFPQYVAEAAFIDALARAATEAGARFAEVILIDDVSSATERFRRRRRDLARKGLPHPQTEVADADVGAMIAEAVERLRDMANARPGARLIEVGRDPGEAYARLSSVLDDPSA